MSIFETDRKTAALPAIAVLPILLALSLAGCASAAGPVPGAGTEAVTQPPAEAVTFVPVEDLGEGR